MRYAVILGIILIAIPLLLKIGTDEPFANAASYEQLRTSQLSSYDSLYAEPHHSTLTDMVFRWGWPQLTLLILATITLLAMSFYAENELFILLFATSPVFIWTFTNPSDMAVGAAFIAIGATLLKRKYYWSVLIVPLCFFLSFPVGILATMTFIAVAIVANLPFVALGASFFALISGSTAALLTPQFTVGFGLTPIAELLGLYGGVEGVTIFLLFLGILGFFIQYMEKHKNEQFAVLLIIPCALVFMHGALIIAALFAYYGSKAAQFLIEREWSFEELRGITLIILACGVLFSGIVTERTIVHLDSDRDDVVRFVNAAYPKGTLILAPATVTPVLAYHGYESYTMTLPESRYDLQRFAQNQGASLVIVQKPSNYNLPIAYTGSTDTSYVAYEIN